MSYRSFMQKHRNPQSDLKSKPPGQQPNFEQLTDPRDLIQAVLDAAETSNQERVDTLVCNAIKTLKVTRFKPDQGLCLALLYLTKMKPSIFTTKPIVESLMTVLKRDLCPAFKVKNNTILPLVAAHIMMAAHADVRHWPSGLSLAIFEEYNKYPIKGFEQVPQNLCLALRQSLFHEFDISVLISFMEFLVNHDKDLIGLSDELARFIVSRHMTVRHIISGQKYQAFFYKTCADVFIRHIDTLMVDTVVDMDATIVLDDSEDTKDLQAQINEPRYAYARIFNGLKLIKLERTTIWGILYLLTLRYTEDCQTAYERLHQCWFQKGSLTNIYTTAEAITLVPLPQWLRLEFMLMGPNHCDIITAGVGDLSDCSQLVSALTTFGIEPETTDFVLQRLDEASVKNAEAVRRTIQNAEYIRNLVESLWDLGHKYGHQFVELAVCI